jgi:hypothetical protein
MLLARLCALALVVLSRPTLAAEPQITVVKASLLIDGMGGAPLRNAVVIVEHERITAVGVAD